jgi:hypothetical protein
MVLKLFKAFWFFSLLLTLGVLMFIYASLPEKVVVQEREAKLIMLPRDAIFYIAMASMALINTLVFVVSKLFAKDIPLRTWFYGLIITLNIFFIVALNLINTFNSGERFDYARIDFIIYGSVGLIVLWASFWPFFSIYRKIFGKSAV